MPEKKDFKNRGRIQAQGGGIEQSEPWAQNEDVTVSQGNSMLDMLISKLSKKEAEIRKRVIAKARRFIENAGKNGGVDNGASFKVKQDKDRRIDIEVQKGIAFVADPDTDDE